MCAWRVLVVRPPLGHCLRVGQAVAAWVPAQERQQRHDANKPAEPKPKADVTYLNDKPENGAFPDFLDDLFGDGE